MLGDDWLKLESAVEQRREFSHWPVCGSTVSLLEILVHIRNQRPAPAELSRSWGMNCMASRQDCYLPLVHLSSSIC